MIAEPKLKLVHELVANATKEELIWINGYLSGLVTNTGVPANEDKQDLLVNKITLVYGTESGNSKKLAAGFASLAKAKGIKTKLSSLDQYRVNDLLKEEYLFAVISTQGDGEPPSAAKKFYDFIHQHQSALPDLKFGILALGDTSYPLFCKAGEDIDSRLKELGAFPVTPLLKCDTDFEADATAWFNNVLSLLSGAGKTTSSSPNISIKKKPGKQIYSGRILSNTNLNDRGSNKVTHHIEIETSELSYEPGDSLGIIPPNTPGLVDDIIKLTGADRDKPFIYKNEEYTIGDLLLKKVNIAHLPERVVMAYATVVQQDIPATSISLVDLLKIYPVRNSIQFEEVIGILEPIMPRLYSISSSPEAHGDELHITVSHNRFCINEQWKAGLCSDFLVNIAEGAQINFYIHKNNRFRLPAEDKDVIMIGPGTGIAPFRSFIAHRDALGAAGRNWLFFGEQFFTSDFLYQTEIQGWVETGVLTRVNTAFSRDQKEKIYVQHKMKRHSTELYNWLNNGAYVYLCGAKDPMSFDVEETILDILKTEGHQSEEEARGYFDKLKSEDRFLTDVY